METEKKICEYIYFLLSLINFQDLSISSLRREEIATYICCKSCGMGTRKYLHDNLVSCPHVIEVKVFRKQILLI